MDCGVSPGIVCRSAKLCSCAPVGNSHEFDVKAVVHQDSVLSPLLFIIMLRRPCHESFVLEFPGRTFMQIILSS